MLKRYKNFINLAQLNLKCQSNVLIHFKLFFQLLNLMALLHNVPLRSFLASLKRNAISLTFPLIAAGLIYSDYSYTQRCKARDIARNQELKNLENVDYE